MSFFDFMTEDIAIDLGTANTLIIHDGKVVVDEPSIVARDRISGKIIATGEKASQMQGKTHENIKTIRPLKDGVIADFEASEQMIKEFIRNIPTIKKKFWTPSLRMVICIPSGITEVEKRAVRDSAEHMNAKEIYLIHEPMAAAIGIGIDITQPKGNMIIDIGGGTTEIAVIALGGIVCDNSVKVAGDVFTNDITYYMRTQHNLYIGERTAFREIAKALDKSIIRIEDAVMETLSKTPPELAADIYNTGIYLAGGGSMLRGLDKRLSRKTDLPVYVAEDPLRAVVRGTGITLKDLEKYSTVLMK